MIFFFVDLFCQIDCKKNQLKVREIELKQDVEPGSTVLLRDYGLGTLDSLRSFAHETLDYSGLGKETGIGAKIEVQFLIDSSGLISGAKITRRAHPEWDTCCINMVRNIPERILTQLKSKGITNRYRMTLTFDIIN